jgi:hypothetical protein
MTHDETVEAMLDTLKEIKDQQTDVPTDGVGTGKDGGCYACGSDDIKREVVAGHGTNRTTSRHVGGQNMRVGKVCRDCGHGWF